MSGKLAPEGGVGQAQAAGEAEHGRRPAGLGAHLGDCGEDLVAAGQVGGAGHGCSG